MQTESKYDGTAMGRSALGELGVVSVLAEAWLFDVRLKVINSGRGSSS